MTVTDRPLEGIDLLAGTWGRAVPHDQFDRLRAEAPVFWHPEPDDTGFWALTKHADVRAASHDIATFSTELGGPFIAETRKSGTPWHPHHIAERYGLLVIIALGEAILGTIAALRAVVGPEGPGWSVEAAVVGFAGVALTFGMWWIYFVIPCGDILQYRRNRSFPWGYGHIPLFGAIVAAGAGLHAAAFLVEEKTKLDVLDTLLTTAIPVAIYMLGIYLLYTYLAGIIDRFHYLLLALSAVVIGASVLVPYHWDGFAGNTVAPGAAADMADARVHVVVPARFRAFAL